MADVHAHLSARGLIRRISSSPFRSNRGPQSVARPAKRRCQHRFGPGDAAAAGGVPGKWASRTTRPWLPSAENRSPLGDRPGEPSSPRTSARHSSWRWLHSTTAARPRLPRIAVTEGRQCLPSGARASAVKCPVSSAVTLGTQCRRRRSKFVSAQMSFPVVRSQSRTDGSDYAAYIRHLAALGV